MMVMFILRVTGGMMAVAQLGVIAQDLGVKEFPVNLYFFTMAALPLRADARPHHERPLPSDLRLDLRPHRPREDHGHRLHAGRHRHHRAGLLRPQPVGLPDPVAASCSWPGVKSTSSSAPLAGDAFGTKHIGKIYGVLYCAKGFGALFVPLGNLMMEATGTWSTVLYTVAAMDLCSAVWPSWSCGRCWPATTPGMPRNCGSRISHRPAGPSGNHLIPQST